MQTINKYIKFTEDNTDFDLCTRKESDYKLSITVSDNLVVSMQAEPTKSDKEKWVEEALSSIPFEAGAETKLALGFIYDRVVNKKEDVEEGGWIKWNGVKEDPPLCRGTLVEVELADGQIFSDLVEDLVWDYSDPDIMDNYDVRIIAYRVLTES